MKEKPTETPPRHQPTSSTTSPSGRPDTPRWAFYPGREWVRDHAQIVPTPVPAPLPQQLAVRANDPPSFKTIFDGTAGKLAFFLSQAWSYINHYGDEFHENREIVSILEDNLENKVSDWFTQLHDELDNVDDFLHELQVRFKDSS
ncbi:hypothetical protein E2320_002349 [Naja naja]|nr:hypothetical protein E2320_002349 [Naja naja]